MKDLSIEIKKPAWEGEPLPLFDGIETSAAKVNGESSDVAGNTIESAVEVPALSESNAVANSALSDEAEMNHDKQS